MSRSAFYQLRAIYSGQGRNLEFSQPLLLGDIEFGSIRIGVSTLLVRSDLDKSLRPAVLTALIALAVSIVGATILAQLLLRPIHVIRSGLTRLGRGEFGVRLDLNQQDEFGELGTFFNTVSAQLSADRSQMAGQVANLESAVAAPRRRRGDRQPEGPGAVCESRDARAHSRRDRRGVPRRSGGRRSSATASGRSDAGQPAIARPDFDRARSPGW